jgi:hypothetical protein
MTVRRSEPFAIVVGKALKMAELSICMDVGNGKETNPDCSDSGRDNDTCLSKPGRLLAA